ncbi:MAG: pyrroline-5-carboxylate reductase [Hylemonella sp.]|nr:pyrroline-5-carboxylate reductase [Hylemonella sp.]
MSHRIAFIGGGNMASAIIGGLVQQGTPATAIVVVEPLAPARQALKDRFGLVASEQAGDSLQGVDLVVWATKPQVLREAATATRPHVGGALHLSVAAGIPSVSLARWLGSERIVRSMPNTPALIGLGMTGLYAREGVTAADRTLIEQVAATMGESLWVNKEDQLDAVTALSGSGPAYVFYFLEAMTQAGTEMGLCADQAYKLALETFRGASALALASSETPETLRQRVTSKGGTTHAAISSMEKNGVKSLFVQAMHAAAKRSHELGAEFGED